MKLSKTESEAHCFGLKLATVIRKGNTINTIVKNHKMKDMGFDKSFIQGMITATMRTGNETTIPRRYVKAFEKSRIKNVTITIPDKESCHHTGHQHS